ncbi:MAG: peptidylprolyl isomerase [Clostridia bacterium]|nr:peptidylprolyl isomerase [Clostridia bacterium]
MVPNPVATITMSDGGQMRFTLYPDLAPNTVANFIKLANRGFYDGQQFFRIVAGVFIQGGDPNNNGTGDPGYAIKGEFADNGFAQNTVSHLRGTISMARPSGYDTAGSQFFIMQGSYPEYDGRYAAFGSIDKDDEASFAVLDAIASQPTDSTYLPLTRQVIATIRVETFDADYGDPETLERE